MTILSETAQESEGASPTTS